MAASPVGFATDYCSSLKVAYLLTVTKPRLKFDQSLLNSN